MCSSRRYIHSSTATDDWVAWLDFFAEAVIVTSGQAVETARQLIDMADEDQVRIIGRGRAADSMLGILRELTGRKRNRVFSYSGYLEIINKGTDPPSP